MNLSVTLKSSLCWILESLCLDRNAPAFIQIGQEAVWWVLHHLFHKEPVGVFLEASSLLSHYPSILENFRRNLSTLPGGAFNILDIEIIPKKWVDKKLFPTSRNEAILWLWPTVIKTSTGRRRVGYVWWWSLHSKALFSLIPFLLP